MGKLYIGDPTSTWREHLKNAKSDLPLLVLDPDDVEFGAPARVKAVHGDKLIWERFYGSLDPLRAPHVLLSAAAQAKERWHGKLDVLCFDYRPNPILRQTLNLIAQLLEPSEIYISSNAQLNLGGFPIGPESVALPAAFPNLVRQAQHRAHWVKMLESCVPHTVDFRDVVFDNCRLGCGTALSREQVQAAGLGESAYAETAGETLFVISESPLNDDGVSRALAVTGARRVVHTDPKKYENLLCSFADQEGNDFGFGKIEKIDWKFGRAEILCNAPPPAPVRILRLGALRVDRNGVELGEVRPWEV